MKKLIKGVLTTVCVVLAAFSFSGCGLKKSCNEFKEALEKEQENHGKILKYGDFQYSYITNAGSNRIVKQGDYVVIFELTEKGYQQETLVIPNSIDQKPVVQFGMRVTGVTDYYYRKPYSGHYTRVYLPSTFICFNASECFSTDNVFLISEPNIETFQHDNHYNKIYVSQTVYDKYKGLDEEKLLRVADVEYYNDEALYWLDNCSWSKPSIIIEPPLPIKSGYNFIGWFEEGSETSWNFENDKLDLTAVDEEGNHPRAKLFAKWEEIKGE